MANQINLSPEQLATLNAITSNGITNLVSGYDYVLGLIEGNPNVDPLTKFRIEGARQVNDNFSTDANILNRGAENCGDEAEIQISNGGL